MQGHQRRVPHHPKAMSTEYVSRKNVCSILIETQGKVSINLLYIRFHRPMSMCPGIMFEYMSHKNVCSIAFYGQGRNVQLRRHVHLIHFHVVHRACAVHCVSILTSPALPLFAFAFALSFVGGRVFLRKNIVRDNVNVFSYMWQIGTKKMLL